MNICMRYFSQTGQRATPIARITHVARHLYPTRPRFRVHSTVAPRECGIGQLDQFLPVRSQSASNQHINSVRTATFQSANFGPLLFAFYCPLLFYENKIKNE